MKYVLKACQFPEHQPLLIVGMYHVLGPVLSYSVFNPIYASPASQGTTGSILSILQVRKRRLREYW